MSEIETFSDFCNNNLCDTCRFKKIAIDEGCSNCEKLFMREHDKQIRADAIDEFDRICEETRSHNFGILPADFLIDVIKAKVKEQLKEQSNESS